MGLDEAGLRLLRKYLIQSVSHINALSHTQETKASNHIRTSTVERHRVLSYRRANVHLVEMSYVLGQGCLLGTSRGGVKIRISSRCGSVVKHSHYTEHAVMTLTITKAPLVEDHPNISRRSTSTVEHLLRNSKVVKAK